MSDLFTRTEAHEELVDAYNVGYKLGRNSPLHRHTDPSSIDVLGFCVSVPCWDQRVQQDKFMGWKAGQAMRRKELQQACAELNHPE